MRKITVFDHVSVDGFFAGPQGEIDWFKAIQKNKEYDAFTHQQSKSGNALILGRTTYEMMKSYWPTPEARKADPEMAKVMDESPKIVFSKKLKSVEEGPNWKNIRLLHDIQKAEITKLKKEAEGDLTILGSGTIVQQFTALGLIDEYTFVVVPIALGAGKQLFKGLDQTGLELIQTRAFKNGLAVLSYRAA